MVKSIILASLFASAVAFAPASQTGRPVSSTTQLFEYKASQALPFLEYPPNLAGYAGDTGFDPFRFSDFLPMDFLREAELKHGRIAMAALVGFAAVDLGLRVYPLPAEYEGLTAATAHDPLVKSGAMGNMFIWFAYAEIFASVALIQTLQGSGRAPGDFGLDGGFFKNKDASYIENMKLKEITHCRLAMLAFSGMVTQSVLYEKGFPYF